MRCTLTCFRGTSAGCSSSAPADQDRRQKTKNLMNLSGGVHALHSDLVQVAQEKGAAHQHHQTRLINHLVTCSAVYLDAYALNTGMAANDHANVRASAPPKQSTLQNIGASNNSHCNTMRTRIEVPGGAKALPRGVSLNKHDPHAAHQHHQKDVKRAQPHITVWGRLQTREANWWCAYAVR
jgi:hypothetical protein